ncbi:hypothetical protein [Yoonia sediminilitoris]|uniref:Adhesin n=1 Tax=Yoonia sediminilitoris TaxID=1286148 RepID=A0A2T6KMK7_9RHOB|nr:hypothetical protein [Yoonia sediminilitoris]PUB17387.1 hypothetical protein C8N45_102399 [Yoonia sediminilitoris]RCW97682.1 hypothetical protein DFP92_102399 [Yoonia sediminilitoris]
MTKKDRTTLKAFFSDGALPTAEDFSHLIDSGVNQIDDGFGKSPDEGLILTGTSNFRRMMSFYEKSDSPGPTWVIDHGESRPSLHVRAGAAGASAPGITVTTDGRLGVDKEEPDWRLDVNGAVRSHGRIGHPRKDFASVKADGEWARITEDLTGCQAFEVIAGVGGEPNQGRYAMTHAIAMNAYHPRNWIYNWYFKRRQIKAQTAVYGSYADRIRLRWKAGEDRHTFYLEMKTNANYGGEYVIRYYLTQLWFDPTMEGSRSNKTQPDGTL